MFPFKCLGTALISVSKNQAQNKRGGFLGGKCGVRSSPRELKVFLVHWNSSVDKNEFSLISMQGGMILNPLCSGTGSLKSINRAASAHMSCLPRQSPFWSRDCVVWHCVPLFILVFQIWSEREVEIRSFDELSFFVFKIFGAICVMRETLPAGSVRCQELCQDEEDMSQLFNKQGQYCFCLDIPINCLWH